MEKRHWAVGMCTTSGTLTQSVGQGRPLRRQTLVGTCRVHRRSQVKCKGRVWEARTVEEAEGPTAPPRARSMKCGRPHSRDAVLFQGQRIQ